jgi:hypothetical protein
LITNTLDDQKASSSEFLSTASKQETGNDGSTSPRPLSHLKQRDEKTSSASQKYATNQNTEDESRATNALIEKIAGKLLSVSDIDEITKQTSDLQPGANLSDRSESVCSNKSRSSLNHQSHGPKSPNRNDHKQHSPNRNGNNSKKNTTHGSAYSHIKSRIDSGRQNQEKSNKKLSPSTQQITIPNVDASLVSFILDEIVENGQVVKFTDIGWKKLLL